MPPSRIRPFRLTSRTRQGSGLDDGEGNANYDIAYVAGELAIATPPVTTPLLPPIAGLPNPPDRTDLTLISDSSESGGGAAIEVAKVTLTTIVGGSDQLQQDAAVCRQKSENADDLLACISQSLDRYSQVLDSIALNLPESMSSVSAVIRQARDGIDQARATAREKLSHATTDAERAAIEREAIESARGSLQTAQTEIRKQISLIRADDPELARIQVQQGNVIVAALASVDLELSRAEGL